MSPHRLASIADEEEAEMEPGASGYEVDELDEDTIDLAQSDVHEEEVQAPQKPRPEPELPAVKRDARRKLLIRAGIAGGICALLVVAGIFAFSGKKKPLPPPVPPQQNDTAAKTPAPPQPPRKPPQKKVVTPKLPPAVAPLPHFGGEVATFAAVRLVAERTASPQVFEKNLNGRRIVVQGTLAQLSSDSLVIADSPQDTSNAIKCTLLKGTLGDLKLQPGQAVVVRGVYASGLRLLSCEVLRTTLPTDEEFKGRIVEVTGTVQQAPIQSDDGMSERFPTLSLTPPTTDSLINVRCLFRQSEREKLATIKPGQTVTVRGRCAGRLFRVVRFHDCAIASPTDPPTPGLVRVAADKFFAAYETDLLPVPRPRPDAVPMVATAEQIAEAFADDLPHAHAVYQHKLVQVSGRILSRNSQSNTVILETGTGHRYQMELVFTPAKFALLRDETVLTARGCCTGIRGSYIRFENSERFDPDSGNAAVRTTADYFPLGTNRELFYDVLTPLHARNNTITRFSVRFNEPDVVCTTPVRTGTFPKATLFDGGSAQPKWTKGAKLKGGQTVQVRVNEDMIEVREKPAPPAQPGAWWDPVLKLGARRGETWTTTMPDKHIVTYTITNFGKDAQGRRTVEITRVVKNPKDPQGVKDSVWEEAVITYAHGVGEVRRVITRQSAGGKGFTILEMRLVEDGTQD